MHIESLVLMMYGRTQGYYKGDFIHFFFENTSPWLQFSQLIIFGHPQITKLYLLWTISMLLKSTQPRSKKSQRLLFTTWK